MEFEKYIMVKYHIDAYNDIPHMEEVGFYKNMEEVDSDIEYYHLPIEHDNNYDEWESLYHIDDMDEITILKGVIDFYYENKISIDTIKQFIINKRAL